MKCPACDNGTLINQERLGISFTQCQECQGVWLDRKALTALQERTGLFLKRGRGQESSTQEGAVGMRRPLWQVLFQQRSKG